MVCSPGRAEVAWIQSLPLWLLPHALPSMRLMPCTSSCAHGCSATSRMLALS